MTATSTLTQKVKPHQRYQLANGDQVPSVTAILNLINKPALVPWANKLGREGVKSSERLAYLAGAGALAHSLIEASLTGTTRVVADYTPGQVILAENALASFHAWARGKAIATRQTELSLVSEPHGYGGALDWYGTVDGRPTLIDFKTSSAIYDDHLYQLAAYHQLLTENGHVVDEARVLRLSRDEDGAYTEKVLPASDLAPYFEVFKAALGLKCAIDATRKRRRR